MILLPKKLFLLLLVFLFLASIFVGIRTSAFTGPSTSAGTGSGTIGIGAANQLSVGTSTTQANVMFLIAGSSTDSSNFALKVIQPNGTSIFAVRNDATLSGGTYTGTVNSSNVSAGVFGSGNFAFPSSLGLATTTQVGLPQTLSVYGGGYFSGNVGIGITSPNVLGSSFGRVLSIRSSTAGNAAIIELIGNTETSEGDNFGRIQFVNDVNGVGVAQIGAIFNGANDAAALFFTTRATGGVQTERMRITSTGNVGIGKTPSTALDVAGTITGTTKNFAIPDPFKPGYTLIHSTLEGPEIAVFYRGTSRLQDGQARVTLPAYFDALTRDGTATVLLTAKGNTPFLLSYDHFDEKSFIVYGSIPDGEFDWEVKATRADQPPLEVELPSR